MNRPCVVFSHGQESGPWGRKITALAEVARSAGCAVESIDYRGIASPDERAARLVAFCRASAPEPLLVGSSLGGYVSLKAAAELRPRGIFLMAPALYFEALGALPACPRCPIAIVHGWSDDVVPYEHSVRFAREHEASLHLIAGDHRLHEQLPEIADLLARFVRTHAAADGE